MVPEHVQEDLEGACSITTVQAWAVWLGHVPGKAWPIARRMRVPHSARKAPC